MLPTLTPKADLGDSNGNLLLHNMSDTYFTYRLSSQALSENIEGGFFTSHSTDWNGKASASPSLARA